MKIPAPALCMIAALACDAFAQHSGERPPALVWNKLKGNCPAALDWAALRGKVVVVSLTAFDIVPDDIADWNEVVRQFQGEQAVFLQIVAGSELLIDQAVKQGDVSGCVLVDNEHANLDNFKLPNFPRTVVMDPLGVIAGYSRGDPDEHAVRAVLNHQLETGLAEVPPRPQPYDPTAGVDPVPSYEVHISTADPREMRSLGQGGPDIYVSKNQPLKLIVLDLWATPMPRIVFPEGLGEERYDVTAHIPVADREQLLKTVQAALENHFGLRISKEERTERVYLLTVSKPSSKLQPSPSGENWMGGGGEGSWSGTAHTMQDITDSLTGSLDVPVIDKTGLKGKYTFSVSSKLSGTEGALDMAHQLGLELIEEERPLEMLVVRSVR
jgi:uncharacterized protein (TIGR03435 family)